MNYKEEIEKLLALLKKEGIDRSKIEQDFDYRENYIDQALSRGGNKKILAALRIYQKAVLQKAINDRNPGRQVKGARIENDPTLKEVMVNLSSISTDLGKVLNEQKIARAEVRAFGQYQVSRDAMGDKDQIGVIMEQIGKLIGANLKANAKEGIPAAGGN